MRNYMLVRYATLQITLGDPVTYFLQVGCLAASDEDMLEKMSNLKSYWHGYDFKITEQRTFYMEILPEFITAAINAHEIVPSNQAPRGIYDHYGVNTGAPWEFISPETFRKKERRKFRLVPIRRR